MQLTPVEQVIEQRRIVVFAPHFDDVLFMLGGYVHALRQAGLLGTKEFHVLVLFPRSNYLAGSGAGNFDRSLPRVKLATGQRIIEDLECLDALLGPMAYRYELAGERECFSRGKSFADSEMEFPHGMYEDFDAEDLRIFARMQARVRAYAGDADTALVFPMAIKEHIDHFIVREAAMHVLGDATVPKRAAFYFQEDKPYGGIATPEELSRMEAFIEGNGFESRVYACDPEYVIDLAFTHYISQVEDVYRAGIRNRAAALARRLGVDAPCDRICTRIPNCKKRGAPMTDVFAAHIGDHDAVQNPGATTYPIHTLEHAPIDGCYTMLNIFTETQYPDAWGVHEDNEGFFVLSGTGSYYIDGAEYALEPGTSMVAPAGRPHGIKKVGKEDLMVFIYHFPARQEDAL